LWISGALIVTAFAFAGIGYRYIWPKPVDVVEVKRGPMPIYLSGPATLDAVSKADLGSRISGDLTSVRVDLNDPVTEGQLLATVEQTDLAAQAAGAQSNLEAARSAELQAEAALASAQATLANAKAVYDRQATLYNQGWVSRASYDQALATYRSAQAETDARRRAVAQAAAQSESVAAQARATNAVLGMAEIRAPFNGVITARNLNPGDLLTPGATVLQVVRPESVILRARFDESEITAVLAGQPAALTFGSSKDLVAGRVLRVSRQVDPETREFTVDIVPSRLPTNWAMNQRATASILTGEHPDAVALPSDCIGRRKSAAGVWVVRSGRAHWQRVTLGTTSRGLTEILSGLTSDQVICGASPVYNLMPVTDEAPR
jgi:HlyD family secretion protein